MEEMYWLWRVELENMKGGNWDCYFVLQVFSQYLVICKNVCIYYSAKYFKGLGKGNKISLYNTWWEQISSILSFIE